MDTNLIMAFKNFVILLWEITKAYPAVIVPTLIAVSVGRIFHMPKSNVNLLEQILGFFF